jgi:pimeloyl-ACP methyl ester carboxylesterase
MPSQLGPLPVEIIAPETDKFTAPLLLVHGLWSGAPAWRRFAGYLAHRGWRCHAVEARGEDMGARLDGVRAAIAALDAPPVIVGHDLGGLLALRCAGAARAVVALAPLPVAPLGDPGAVLRGAGTWWERWRGAPLRPPRGAASAAYPDRRRSESAALLAALQCGEGHPSPPPAPVPAAIFAGERDVVLTPGHATAMARALGAEAHVLPGAGHALLNDAGWEAHVAAVHRWIVRRLGVDLLALYDEAWEGREP